MKTAKNEIELKRLLIGEGAADKLVAALGQVRAEKRQVNHVFDTDDRRLHARRYALRLREENGVFSLTAKGPGRSVGAHTDARPEAEAEIDRAVADEVLSGRRDPVAALREREPDPAFAELWRGLDEARDGAPLREAGHFENLRRVVPFTLGHGVSLEAEIDRTRFAGGRIDDEIEIEVPDETLVAAVEDWLEKAAASAGIETAPSTAKIARFYESLRAP